ncbi:MAG: TrkH family potassium uptake protein [Kineosporiaceae bacterium]|nr:TrkH family potassium uptake protein [Kineosporiaceae bacterium]
MLRRVTIQSPGRAGRRRELLRHPAQVMVFAFGAAIWLGTAVLMLPVSREGPSGAPLLTALFTATSATCVTGLAVVDTATYWTPFGQVVIAALIQVGGFGIMTMASLLALFVTKRMGLKTRLTAAAETKSLGPGDLRRVLVGVFKITALVELTIATLLTLRWWLGYGESFGRSLYLGVFHAVSSFNNAGFALFSDNLIGFASDPFILLPISLAIILGGLGFPVILELLGRAAPHRWSIHTQLTVIMTLALLIGGWVFLAVNEWTNPGTLGEVDVGTKLLSSFFHSVQPRTAGFNAWDYAQIKDASLLGTIVLMFIGGGSASTAGGLKVTTFILLFFVILAEARGEEHVNVFRRRIDPRTSRQALTVALLGVAAVVGSTMILSEISGFPLRDVMFEATSAFGTVGLSTGITPQLPGLGQLVLIVLMFLGRLGPVTLVSALVLREHQRRYTFPEGRPLIG